MIKTKGKTSLGSPLDNPIDSQNEVFLEPQWLAATRRDTAASLAVWLVVVAERTRGSGVGQAILDGTLDSRHQIIFVVVFTDSLLRTLDATPPHLDVLLCLSGSLWVHGCLQFVALRLVTLFFDSLLVFANAWNAQSGNDSCVPLPVQIPKRS